MVFGRSEAVGRAGAAGATGDWAAGVTAERRSLCRSLSAESFALMGMPSRWHSALSLAISPAGAMAAFYRVRRGVCWFMAYAGAAPAPEDPASSSLRAC